jgi:prepilin-type N-terminal cleavage/methylation domain-containing protein
MTDDPTEPTRRGRSGFTMIEVMVVLVIMGVVIAVTAPSFQRSVEKARADVALANLRAICAAERYYWLENRYYTESLSTLVGLDILPSEVNPSSGSTPLPSYQYTVQYSPSTDPSTFTVTALRINSSRWQGSFTIDQTGTITGQIQDQESAFAINAPNGL